MEEVKYNDRDFNENLGVDLGKCTICFKNFISD